MAASVDAVSVQVMLAKVDCKARSGNAFFTTHFEPTSIGAMLRRACSKTPPKLVELLDEAAVAIDVIVL